MLPSIELEWGFDIQRLAYRLTVRRGEDHITVLIDPNPPTESDLWEDVENAIRAARQTFLVEETNG